MMSVSAPDLSPRMREAMRWVMLGKSDAEMGRLMGVSTATAHFHVEGAKAKLDVGSRTYAAAILFLAGRL